MQQHETGGPTCSVSLSPCTVHAIGAVHSVCPYPSTTKQPKAQRMNVKTLPANGADPTTIKRKLPPNAKRKEKKVI